MAFNEDDLLFCNIGNSQVVFIIEQQCTSRTKNLKIDPTKFSGCKYFEAGDNVTTISFFFQFKGGYKNK